MNTFEEKYTAWIDGRLPQEARIAFEKELETVSAATADRADAHRLGELLRKYGGAPPLPNGEFFSHQLEQRIRLREAPSSTTHSPGWWRWSIPQLVSAGAACLLVALVLFKTIVPEKRSNFAAREMAPYFAEVVDVWPADPTITATTVYTPQDNLTVVWLEGLDYLPASYDLQ